MTKKERVEVTIVNKHECARLNVEAGTKLKGTYLGIDYTGDIEDGINTGIIVVLDDGRVTDIWNYDHIRFIKEAQDD